MYVHKKLLKESLVQVKSRYLDFINSTHVNGNVYRLTTQADPSPFARCFALFGYNLLQQEHMYVPTADSWANDIRQDLKKYKEKRQSQVDNLLVDKAYLQLLTFSLSALTILGKLEDDPLEALVVPFIRQDIDAYFNETSILEGEARTGNLAMFFAILLIHARDYLHVDTSEQIEKWVSLHLDNMNQFGFWGEAKSISHLQFQNGYHQYEIFDYLDVDNPVGRIAVDQVASLADGMGHFAPYVGGGGCYDYDAVFILTANGSDSIDKHQSLLLKTALTILSEQNTDGGFGESQYIRPRSLSNVCMALLHIFSVNGPALKERARYSLSLMRSKHHRITTHWSQYSREWGESDLWDSWFRMMLIARITVAISPERIDEWGFINYPGIGYHSGIS